MQTINIQLPNGAYIKTYGESLTYHRGGTETYQIDYVHSIEGIHFLEKTIRRVGPAARLSKNTSLADPSAILQEIIDCLHSKQIDTYKNDNVPS